MELEDILEAMYQINTLWLRQNGRLFADSIFKCITINTLRLRQNERHFANEIFKHSLMNENCCIMITISLKFVPTSPINNIPALVR